MNTTDLIAALDVSKAQLRAWVKLGLPYATKRGRRDFDPQAVRDWLVARGLAKAVSVVGTVAEAAQELGVSQRTVAGWLAAGCPGRRGCYDLDAIQAWRSARRDATDPLLAGAPSAALERYRTARAEMAELEVQERKNNLIDRHVEHDWLMHTAHVIRRAGEQLQREYGQGAANILNEALDQIDRETTEHFSDLPEDNGNGQTTQANGNHPTGTRPATAGNATPTAQGLPQDADP